MRRFALGLICAILILPTISVQAQESVGARVLEQRTVRLSMTGSSGSFSCLGFRLYREDFPADVGLVLTAAHCVTDLGTNPVIVASTLSGQVGRAVRWVFWKEQDVALVVVTPNMGLLDPIRNFWPDPPQGLRVLAMITVGDGRPTLASGIVLGTEGVSVNLVLPGAPGSSGGAVVDLDGALVGMIASGEVYGGGSASPFVKAVGAGIITRLHNQERDRLAGWAREASRPTAPAVAVAPSPSPAPIAPPTPIPPPLPTTTPAPPPVTTTTPPTPLPAPAPTLGRSQPSFDDRIVPGDRISGIALGMSLNAASAAAITTFGGVAGIAEDCTSPQERGRGLSCRIRGWLGEGQRLASWITLVGPPGQETVGVVATSLVRHRTDDGLGRGSTLEDFVRAFGEPRRGTVIEGSRTRTFSRDGSPVAFWPRYGIGVFYNPQNGLVWAIAVFN